MYKYFYENKKGISNSKILELHKMINENLRLFYELFYKYDREKLIRIDKNRKQIMEKGYNLFEQAKDKFETISLHHLLNISHQIFCLIEPYLTMEK